jgi:acyl-CoA thioesterase-1
MCKRVGISILGLLLLAGGLSAERIVFLGDSLTAGYGLDPEQAYPKLVETALREKGSEVTVVNAGVSGDTTAGGLRRLNWILRQPVDTLFIALGANDALRGQSVEAAKDNLRDMIRTARKAYPEARIILAGMLAPPNMGQAYQEAFAQIYPDLAKSEDVELLPFLLDGVAGEPQLNLADGTHPNAEGHRRIARLVIEVLDGS